MTTPMTDERLAEIKAREKTATPGPWVPCHHLESIEADASCPCGYRGGIWGGDKEHIVCEIGSAESPGEEGLAAARYERQQEIDNAAFITQSRNDVPDLIAEVERLRAENERLRDKLYTAQTERDWQQFRAAEIEGASKKDVTALRHWKRCILENLTGILCERDDGAPTERNLALAALLVEAEGTGNE